MTNEEVDRLAKEDYLGIIVDGKERTPDELKRLMSMCRAFRKLEQAQKRSNHFYDNVVPVLEGLKK